jgi:hypothetical protein
MEPHVHKDVIIAFANGYKIQSCAKGTDNWTDVDYPNFFEALEYRVKPKRTFIHGAFYPVIHKSGHRDVVYYCEVDDAFYMTASDKKLTHYSFTFIGVEISPSVWGE